jgi:hypothetical protein
MMKNVFILICSVFIFSCTIKEEQSIPDSTTSFSYDKDSFSDSALLDLRGLNEKYAGEHGFIKLSDDNESFVRGDGEPIRFWAVNNGAVTRDMNDDDLAYHARFLAKIGVNMARYHGSVNPAGKNTQITDTDSSEIHNIWRYVAAMKKEGIYSTISPFWAHNGHMGGWVPEEWGIAGYSGKDPLWAVMYFNDKLKEAYKVWVKELYTKTNPYTGIALKDDPAVGIIQIKNEDGLFFWTMQNIKPELEEMISRQFYDWVVKKYGSIDQAYSNWNNLILPDDDSGSLEIFNTWHMTIDLEKDSALRMADQAEFYAKRQHDFYKEIYEYYRDDLGCKQLINANNWKTANNKRLNDLERYTYMACDIAAVNRYYSPGHSGEKSGWRIDPGHFYTGNSVLHYPEKFPLNIKKTSGMPMIVTESGWNLPHKYQAEGPFLISAYQSLMGLDGYYWFSISDKDYDSFPYFEAFELEDDQHPMHRWTCSAPWGIGMFPANALTYRKGYVKEARNVVVEKRSYDSLWHRVRPVITENAGFDPNRDRDNLSIEEGTETLLSPMVFLTGGVEWKPVYGETSLDVNQKIRNLIDYENNTIESLTGELEWNYEKGIVSLNSPKSQGICGFILKNQKIELEDVSIITTNDYLVLQVVSMDEEPLYKSRKLLIQTGRVWRPENWKDIPGYSVQKNDTIGGYRIMNTGNMPWKAKELKVSITLKNRHVNKAFALSSSGYPEKELETERKGRSMHFQLPPDALYVVLTD